MVLHGHERIGVPDAVPSPSRSLMRPSTRAVAAVLLVSVMSCSASDSPTETSDAATSPTTPVATTLMISDASASLSGASVSFSALGDTKQLTAAVFDQDGTVMSAASVSWASSNPSVASVSDDGLATASQDFFMICKAAPPVGPIPASTTSVSAVPVAGPAVLLDWEAPVGVNEVC